MNNSPINISEIANKLAAGSVAGYEAIEGEYQQHSGVYTAQDFVDLICVKLRAITKGYTRKMVNAGGEVVYKRQLALALAKNYLTTDELIEPALNFYRNNDEWMPTPAQFIKLCMSRHAQGCPPARDAYLEYVQNAGKSSHQWTHEIVPAAVRLSKQGYEIRSLPEEKAFLVYERSYQILMDRILKGESIDRPIPKALPTEASGRQLRPKENLSMLQQMREDVGL